MSEAAKMRLERIERLLHELVYEITRGVMEREIEPDLHLVRTFPCAGRGDNAAIFEAHVYPALGNNANSGMNVRPRLRVVQDNSEGPTAAEQNRSKS